MEELNILEVPRILADTRYSVNDRLKLADQFSDMVVKELGPLLTNISKFIDSKEHDKFSRIGKPEDIPYIIFVDPAHDLARLTPEDNVPKYQIDLVVKKITEVLESLIKTKNILGV